MRRKLTYDPAHDYYVLLGLEGHATAEDIRQAYRRGVREVHPDLNPDRAEWATEQLQRINEAYTVLSDPALRAEYDRLRWPYAPARAATPRGNAPPAPAYDDARPWWEQVRAPFVQGSARWPGALEMSEASARALGEVRPAWLQIAGWLRQHRLARLEALWLLGVGVWRSPYRGVLTVLGVVFLLNSALIGYVAGHPDALQQLQTWLAPDPTLVATSLPITPPPTPTVALLAQACADPAARITVPVAGDVVGDSFSVYGTVQVEALWSYEIAVGYLGPAPRATAPATWLTVRPAPLNQSIPEPAIVEGLLTDAPVDLSGLPAGYYAVRLRVMLRDGTQRDPCDVIVVH